jgi:GH15 family glucan-1,4-alpha-glucosidase
MLPLVGFLPPDDPRVLGTIDAIERELSVDGLILRYRPQEEGVDGLPGDEGAFLACSFWLVDALALCGRREDARKLFERLLALRSPTGLLAEEYDVKRRRLCGNYPQAFSHVGLINAARSLLPPEEEAPGHATPEGEPERAAREKSAAAPADD